VAGLERALEALYEDANLRDELRDPEAQQLLTWAETRLTALADGASDDAFDEQADTLRGLLKAINRFVGRRAELDAETRRARLATMVEQAKALGAAPTDEHVNSLLQSLDTLDDAAALQAVTALFTPQAAPAASSSLAIQVVNEPTPQTLTPNSHGESTPNDETPNHDDCS
jgi:hypothetical protein